jgi:hypothetical protein
MAQQEPVDPADERQALLYNCLLVFRSLKKHGKNIKALVSLLESFREKTFALPGRSASFDVERVSAFCPEPKAIVGSTEPPGRGHAVWRRVINHNQLFVRETDAELISPVEANIIVDLVLAATHEDREVCLYFTDLDEVDAKFVRNARAVKDLLKATGVEKHAAKFGKLVKCEKIGPHSLPPTVVVEASEARELAAYVGEYLVFRSAAYNPNEIIKAYLVIFRHEHRYYFYSVRKELYPKHEKAQAMLVGGVVHWCKHSVGDVPKSRMNLIGEFTENRGCYDQIFLDTPVDNPGAPLHGVYCSLTRDDLPVIGRLVAVRVEQGVPDRAPVDVRTRCKEIFKAKDSSRIGYMMPNEALEDLTDLLIRKSNPSPVAAAPPADEVLRMQGREHAFELFRSLNPTLDGYLGKTDWFITKERLEMASLIARAPLSWTTFGVAQEGLIHTDRLEERRTPALFAPKALEAKRSKAAGRSASESLQQAGKQATGGKRPR